MHSTRQKRVVIEKVAPEIDGGRFPIKRRIGEKVCVEADIFTDGNQQVSAECLYRFEGQDKWETAPMEPIGNDRWRGVFTAGKVGKYVYTIQAWIDRLKSWQRDFKKKLEALQDVDVDLIIGAQLLAKSSSSLKGEAAARIASWEQCLRSKQNREEALSLAMRADLTDIIDPHTYEQMNLYDKELSVVVEREASLFSTWYELFPRSCTPDSGRHGTFSDCEGLLPEIARLGFDVIYLPPIHPIGKTRRKGKNNTPEAELRDPGSPWAIGSEEGGHKAIHPDLGSMADFERFVTKAKDLGMELALDLAFQCSHDHPYIKEHPEWFSWRPDGTIQFAENPPKKYEDIVPLNFETDSWRELWNELKSVVLFWADRRIRIFRVDNPHTKPFNFWEWLIREVKEDYPDVLFLSEAFTRPKVKYHLAKIGFSQSYTYFTWRNTKQELTAYLDELLKTEVREYFRPNFWPNTPDILPEFLQFDGKPAFIIRLVLAATLSSNYGIYGPPFELCIHDSLPGKEEYSHSEKYEIKEWNWEESGNLKDLISEVNRIRRENRALQVTGNLKFYEVDNDYLLFYGKATEDLENILLILINLDPFHTQSGWVKIPLDDLGIEPNTPYLVDDLLSRDKFFWQGERNYVELNPHLVPVHIFRIKRHLRREKDFDYFM